MIRGFEFSVALLCFLVVRLVAAEPEEVVARWEELAPLVEKREIETVLANGVHLRGRVEKVLPEALEVRVKRTSEPNVVPKGRTRVPRQLVSVLTVHWRQGPARALFAVAGWFGLPLFLAASGLDLETVGTAGWLAIGVAGAAAGYLFGADIDAESLRIVVRDARHAGPGV